MGQLRACHQPFESKRSSRPAEGSLTDIEEIPLLRRIGRIVTTEEEVLKKATKKTNRLPSKMLDWDFTNLVGNRRYACN
ncbi:MAG: hypothetical protein DMF11_03570 [Verrucomicrobia bacterium]|nr:MAG: hypothetical protein DMF11_03570 [Verrucomicrobiota bacterium]